MQKRGLITMVLATMMLSLFLVSCSQKVPTPEQSAMALSELYLKGTVDSENLPFSDEEAKQFIKDSKELSKTALMEEFDIDTIPNELFESIFSNIEAINKKAEIKTELVSTKDDQAVVKISVSAIDEDLFEKSLEARISKLTLEQLANPVELVKVMNEELKTISANPKFTSKPNTINITLSKKSGQWMPLDDNEMAKFEELSL